MESNKVLYEELIPDEFAARIQKAPIAYLPLGTLEWHSFHLPYGADGIQSQGVFCKIAERVGGIVLPMLFLGPDSETNKNGQFFYGMDGYSFEEDCEQQLAGSVYHISTEQFSQLLDTIMENLARAGFQMVIAHGHGPSTHLFADRQNYYKERFNLITHTLWELGVEGDNGIQTDHAATNETAITMALRPELVDMNKLPKKGIPVSVWGPDPRLFATPEHGKKVIETNVELISQKLEVIIPTLRKPDINMEYKNIKNMLR